MTCTVDPQCCNYRNAPNHLQFKLDLDPKGLLCYGKDSLKYLMILTATNAMKYDNHKPII